MLQEYIDLSKNKLVGTIPSFEPLNMLTYVDLHSNRLEGPLPQIVSSQNSDSLIEELYFADNYLSGTLPSDYGSHLLTLKAFHVDATFISGTIPESYGKLTNLSR